MPFSKACSNNWQLFALPAFLPFEETSRTRNKPRLCALVQCDNRKLTASLLLMSSWSEPLCTRLSSICSACRWGSISPVFSKACVLLNVSDHAILSTARSTKSIDGIRKSFLPASLSLLPSAYQDGMRPQHPACFCKAFCLSLQRHEDTYYLCILRWRKYLVACFQVSVCNLRCVKSSSQQAFCLGKQFATKREDL